MDEVFAKNRLRCILIKMNYNPNSTLPFKLSRSKIDLFLDCPKCFYLDRRLGISRPPMPSFSLNSAVDFLLKKEFDIHRQAKMKHPLMAAYKIDAIPLSHEKIEDWRNTFIGISHLHPKTNFLVFGAIDDVWVNPKGELIIVDYKSTSTSEEITLEDKPGYRYKAGYKRQMEIYQWLFRQNGFAVSETGYFVYANASKDRKAFDGKLEFDIKLISYNGDDSWLEKTLSEAKKCLLNDDLPPSSESCEYCRYVATINHQQATINHQQSTNNHQPTTDN